MVDYVIMPAIEGHCALLAANMRREDAEEVRSFGESRIRAVNRAFRSGLMCRSVFVDGEIGAMWGMGGNVLSNVGHPWLLTTPAIERIPVSFVKHARREIAAMLDLRPVLYDYVAARYTRAVHFLTLLGFRVYEPEPFGRHRLPFCRFEMRAAQPAGH